jgi:hypothetical protein
MSDDSMPMVVDKDGTAQTLQDWVHGEDPQAPAPTFTEELQHLLNMHCVENESNTPDFILAQYLRNCLDAWLEATRARDSWYDITPRPGWRANFDLEAPDVHPS